MKRLLTGSFVLAFSLAVGACYEPDIVQSNHLSDDVHSEPSIKLLNGLESYFDKVDLEQIEVDTENIAVDTEHIKDIFDEKAIVHAVFKIPAKKDIQDGNISLLIQATSAHDRVIKDELTVECPLISGVFECAFIMDLKGKIVPEHGVPHFWRFEITQNRESLAQTNDVYTSKLFGAYGFSAMN